MAKITLMEQESRVKKSLLNARVNLICYFASLFVAFFTRKVFLDQLGAEFIGLTGTLSSLLGFLNLAELGVAGAIAYVLYKPIHDGDKNKINEVVSLLGYLYQKIGLFILGAGIILSCFIPLIFSDTEFSWGIIYLGFYAYLTSSMLGYFVNYRMSLLSADQRNYEVTGLFQIANSTKTIVQMLLAIKFQNFALFLCLEILFGLINSTILNYRINRVYPWLKTELKQGRELFKKYPEVWKYIKQLFAHKIGGFVQFQLIPILIYPFASLATVALYGNYTILTARIQGLMSNVLDSTGAGVGNLISDGDQERIYAVYKELMAARILIAGVLTCCVFRLTSQFIGVWLGEEYILSDSILLLVCTSLFLSVSRGTNDQFLFGYGLFYDIWAPLVESAILVGISLLGGTLLGFEGVLLGPIASLVIIVHIWKPYFLFSKGFKRSFLNYFVIVAKHIAPILISYIASDFLLDKLNIALNINLTSWFEWLYTATIFTILISILSLVLNYVISSDLRIFIHRFIKK
ncbi:MAG: sugar transporter [Rikenellaceae bacterium]